MRWIGAVMSVPEHLSGRLLGLSVAAALLLSACGGTAVDTAADTAGTAMPAAVAAPGVDVASAAPTAGERGVGPPALGHPGKAVPAALRFDVAALGGGRVSGATLLGTAAVVWFWTPWCPVCRAEAPDVAAAAAKYAGRVRFLGVGAQGDVSSMHEFASATGVDTFEQAVDADGSVWAGFGVVGQPSFAFLGPDGGMTVVPGELSAGDLDRRIERLPAS